MCWKKLLLDYADMFGEQIGIPWEGFPERDIELAYWDTLQECIETGVPITDDQRKRFFPEFEPGVIY